MSSGSLARFSRSTPLRYLSVVGAAALVDLGGFVALVGWGVIVPIAAVASFLSAAAFNYVLSALFVFRRRPALGHFSVFLGFGLVGLLLNSGTTWFAAAHGLQPFLAKMMGIGLAFAFNTSANFLVVFRRPVAVRSGYPS